MTLECDCFSELVIDLSAVFLKKSPFTGDKPLGPNRGPIDGRGQPTSLFQVGSPAPLGMKTASALAAVSASAFDILAKLLPNRPLLRSSMRIAQSAVT